jgi:hypothetical protein
MPRGYTEKWYIKKATGGWPANCIEYLENCTKRKKSQQSSKQEDFEDSHQK